MSNYYITNIEIEKEINDYKNNGKMSNKLGSIFIDIATNYANKGKFSGYTWKADMIGEAVCTCVRYAHCFDSLKQEKPNPFAYFTQICHHAFINFIKKQKKHSEIKDICMKNMFFIDNDDQIAEKAINYENLK